MRKCSKFHDCGNLHRAIKAKDDEFYTPYDFIDSELSNYEDVLYGKSICLPCNDADMNFHKWFEDHKESLHLKRVVAVHYSTDSFSSWYIDDGVKKVLPWGGDFRSYDVCQLIKECDIIVTNPPFTLFTDFIRLMVRFDKKFIVLGNNIAVQYYQTFELFRTRQLELGYYKPSHAGNMFDRPDGSQKGVAIYWYQNVKHIVPAPLELTQTYSPDRYQKYDDYDAIECQSRNDIPVDYYGPIGVPVSYIPFWDPNEFDLLDNIGPHLNGKQMFKRFVIQRKKDH